MAVNPERFSMFRIAPPIPNVFRISGIGLHPMQRELTPFRGYGGEIRGNLNMTEKDNWRLYEKRLQEVTCGVSGFFMNGLPERYLIFLILIEVTMSL